MNFSRIVLASVAFSCLCSAQSPREIAQVAFKSVVLLQMNDANGQPLSLGSGFFISSGTIATNAHVIEGASSGTAKLIGDTHTMKILGIVAIDRQADLALLRVNSSAPSLMLKSSTSPSVGDKVYVVGNPLGLEGTFSEGIISGLRRNGVDSLLQMTAPISPGSSGGPVMDNSGSVIGISVATFKEGQNLNLAVPAIYLSKLLTSPIKGLVPPGIQEPERKTTKSVFSDAGTKVENGLENALTVSEFSIYSYGLYKFKLTNRSPVTVSSVQLRILYYDASGSLMDFENISSPGSIPAGLTKTINNPGSEISRHAGSYYYAQNIANPTAVRLKVE